jgi:hypothetical protein
MLNELVETPLSFPGEVTEAEKCKRGQRKSARKVYSRIMAKAGDPYFHRFIARKVWITHDESQNFGGSLCWRIETFHNLTFVGRLDAG